MTGDGIAAGDCFVVVSAFEAFVAVQLAAPCSGGETRELPPGLTFAVWGDPAGDADAVSARPLEPSRWETRLVASDDPLYGGFALVIMKSDLGIHCTRL